MRIRRRSGIVSALAIGLVTFGVVGSVSAASATLKIVVDSPTIAQGDAFTVRVVQNASGPTSGSQATVTFDQTKVQVQSVTKGSAHAGAPIFLPADLPGAIAQANSSGKLKQVATAFLPPASVPAGNQDFLVISFKATGCGTVSFGLPVGPSDATMLDGSSAGYGNPIPVTTTGATVNITCGSGASSGASSSGAAQTGAPGPSATTGAAGPTATTGSAGPSSTADAGSSDIPGAGTTTSGSAGGPPLWLPLVVAIPALAVLTLGLLRWRRTRAITA